MKFHIYVHGSKEDVCVQLMDQGLSEEDAIKYRGAAYEHRIEYEVVDGKTIVTAIDGKKVENT